MAIKPVTRNAVNMCTTESTFLLRFVVAVLCVLPLALFTPSPTQAQFVTGQVVDSMSGNPVGAGFVVLLASDDSEAARTLTTNDGRFRLEAPTDGIYRLRSERIGYRAFTSQPFELQDGQTENRTLEVRAQAIMLAAVEVRGEDRCRINPDEAEETALVWQEIRKALAATAWDGTQELARFRLYGYQREWDAGRRRIRVEHGSVLDGLAGQPFVSLPASRLAREGFVVERPDGIQYNLPDAAVLQDDLFLASHCFHVVRDVRDKPGQIGLAFQPLSRRGLPDVRGTLWLDEATSELRVLEVSFTRLQQNVDDERVGGTVEFLMLPSGAWIVHRWQMRTPLFRVVTSGNRSLADGQHRRTSIVGFHDTGGNVLAITARDGTTHFPPGLAHLAGTVFDSTKIRPLADVVVSIESTPLEARTNNQGVYHLTAPFEGEYSVTLSHPWLDSLGLMPPVQEVNLLPDDTNTVSFAIPHANSIVRSICDYPDGPLGSATVVGSVFDGRSGRPVEGLDVGASWQVLAHGERGLVPTLIDLTVRTGESGSFVFCGLPLGHPVTIGANGARSANVLFPRTEGGLLLFARDRDPTEPYGRAFTAGHRTWRVDLGVSESERRQPPEGSRPILSGYVSDRSTGFPVDGVVISLNGTDSAITRSDGTFDIVDVPWRAGTNYVATRRLDYLPWAQEIWLTTDHGWVNLSIRLESQAYAVDSLHVTTEAVDQVLTDVGFYARQQSGVGYFLDREQIERKLGAAMSVTDLLTGVAGIQVLDAGVGRIGSTVTFRGIRTIGGANECGTPLTFLDGVAVEFETLEMGVEPGHVFAIEAYRRPSEIPTQYRGANSACGVLLIWTRRGR